MLESFVRVNDIDILMVQEVTETLTTNLQHYLLHFNIGINRSVTAFIVRETLNITNVARLPSGRAIVADIESMRVVNIYAPSGTAKRKERETFYNKELPAMLETKPVDILGGEFNCVLEGSDATGQGSYGRALAMLIKGCSFYDTWHQRPGCEVFTHHSVHGRTRLDIIYVTTDLLA
jgi:exonuclease III